MTEKINYWKNRNTYEIYTGPVENMPSFFFIFFLLQQKVQNIIHMLDLLECGSADLVRRRVKRRINFYVLLFSWCQTTCLLLRLVALCVEEFRLQTPETRRERDFSFLGFHILSVPVLRFLSVQKLTMPSLAQVVIYSSSDQCDISKIQNFWNITFWSKIFFLCELILLLFIVSHYT